MAETMKTPGFTNLWEKLAGARAIAFVVPLCGALLALIGCGGGESSGPTDEEVVVREPPEQCDDGMDNDNDGFTDCEDLDCRAESDDCDFAPELDRSIVSNIYETSRFLYTGPDPVQKEVDEQRLDFWRASLIHGRVVDVDGEPLRDVRVSVKDRPEYGFTETRFDGRYDLVVNGGGVLVLDFEHEGHIHVQRSVATDWQREHVAPVVGLVPLSGKQHRVSLGSGEAVEAEAIDDKYGKRQPFLVFPEWLKAEAVLPDGDTQPLDELTLRVTQYPFEPATPTTPNGGTHFAPGSLPTRGGFNYSVEISVEEAEELGASSVNFSEPVAYYVENFLGLPTGTSLPLRSYNRTTSEWESMGSGVVIEVVDIQAGLAQLDSDGDGEADSADELERLGVFRQEREELALRSEPGDTLMRNRVIHFSTLTQVWEVIAGGTPAPADLPFTLKRRVDKPIRRGKVLVDERVAQEAVELAGTPYALVYQGNRSHGHGAAFRVQIPLVGDNVPSGLTDVFVVADIGGRLFPEDPAERRLAPEPGLTHEFFWDGRNSFDQLLQGEQIARVWVGYGFQGATLTNVAAVTPEEVEEALPFALPSTVLWSWQDLLLGMLDTQGFQFGGFGLNVQHAFDPVQQVLYYGDGRQRTASGLHQQIVAIDQSAGATGSGLGDALLELEAPDSMAAADDGSVFVSDDGGEGRIWRISPSGEKGIVLGPGAPGAAGEVELLAPQGVALDPSDGTLFVVDWEGLKVLLLRPNGTVGVLLGDDPQASIQEPLSDPDGVAVGPNRELYVSDANRVLKVNVSSGTLDPEPYLGGVEPGSDIEVLPVMHATDVPLDQASGITVDQITGSVYVASRFTHQVWRVEPNQQAFLVAGTGTPGFSGDGGLAVDAELEGPRGVALGRDGSLFIADQENFRVRRVFPSGEITTVAGGGDAFPSSITPGPSALVNRPDGLAFAPDGSLFAGGGAVETEQPHLFRLSPSITSAIGSTDFIVPSDDGSEAYRFDQNGQHLATIDVMTGVTRLNFEYDDSSLLSAVRDHFDVVTTIERNSKGEATAVIGPFGHTSTLSYNAEGGLESVTAIINEDDETARERRFEYDDASGLLNVIKRGSDVESSYEFDGLGRITSVTDPTGQVEEYASLGVAGAQRVSVTNGAEDVYDRLQVTADLVDGFSFEDADSQTVSALELLDRTFSSTLAGDTRVTGETTTTEPWGEQVRIPGRTTFTTPEGRELTKSVDVTATGVQSTATGAVPDPLDFETYETTVGVNGVVYKHVYNRNDRTLTRTSPMGRVSVTTYNEQGLPERVQGPSLAETTYSYDDLGRVQTVAQVADGSSRTTRYEYGDDGRLQTLTDPLGQTTSYVYDGVGRLTRIIRNDGEVTEIGYDGSNNVASVTPPARPKHDFSYDGGLRPSLYAPPLVGTANAGTISYGFDEFSRPLGTTLSDGSSIEHKYYQDFYRPSQLWVSRGSGSSEEVFYLTYHPSDRNLVQSVYGPRNGVVLDYDPPLLTRAEFQTESASGVINLRHDDLFRVSELHLVGSARVPYTYDDDSLVTGAGPLSITRNPENGLITDTSVRACVTNEIPNGFGELERHSASFADQELFSQTFQRDELGRITQLTEATPSSTSTTSYTYDEAGRLASATIDGVLTEYFYDANDNRFPDSELSLASYDDQDRVASFGDLEFQTSAVGDVTRRTNATGSDGLELVYGTRGELLRATVLSTGDRVTYENDPFGRRVGRRLNDGAPKGWLYDNDLRVIAEIDDNAARTDFIYATKENVPDLMFKYGTTFFRLVTDHLGSVRLVVNVETGEVAQELAYDPWGKVITDTNPGFQPFGFAGGLYDPATGLVRFGARDYDPEVGRWTRKDPIQFIGGQTNLYVYVGNDPVNSVDLTGLRPLTTNEKALLAKYYGKTLNVDVIDIDSSIAGISVEHFASGMSPFGNQILLKPSHFVGGDSANEIDFKALGAKATLVHEAFHVWQRQHGTWVTLEGFLTQTAWSIERNIFGSNYLDPYAYDDSTGQGIYMQFLVGGVEQQAEIFEDYARADMMGKSTAKYRKVAWIVKNWR